MNADPTHTPSGFNRRTALSSLGAGGLAVAFATTPRPASGQEATPAVMAGHPIVGTWIVDRNSTDPTEAPTLNVFTADGAAIDPVMNVGGVWQATGPRTAGVTLVGVGVVTRAGGGPGSYAVIRSTAEVDAAGETITGSASITVVAADGTVLFTGQGPNSARRLHLEPEDAMGMPLTGGPTWTPAAEATPTS